MRKNILKILVLVAIDQLIKFIIFGTIGKSGNTITIIPNILQFTYIENTGAAFGMFMSRILLIGLDIMIIFVVAKLMLSKKYEFGDKANLGFSLILAGGMGNLIDRIFRGYVIDYIDITQLFSYPVFNFADICIVLGVILIMVVIIINTIKSQENMNEKV